MKLLTPSGYKNIEYCEIGEQLIAYDINNGSVIVNELLSKEWFCPDRFVDEYSEEVTTVDENGELIIDPPVLIKTKEEVFAEVYGEPIFYLINGTYTVSAHQSVWANMRVIHASQLQVGDVIYDGIDGDVTITSISEITKSGWWRLSVSGDHSYISDGLTLHNASRYWVGGGASANWSATSNTNWGSSSGTQDNASVPGSADDVTFDGAGTSGNSNSTISATITILSLNITTGYTATMTHNAVVTIAGNWTFNTGYTIAGTSGVAISATSTITSNGKTWPNGLTLSNANTARTLVGDLTVNGLVVIAATVTINKTVSERLTCAGGINPQLASNAGTADIYLTGGSWSGNQAINNNLYLNGDVTISGNVTFNGSNLTYISGLITTTGSQLTLNGIIQNVDSNGVLWDNFRALRSGLEVILKSDLNINGLFIVTGSPAFNKTSSEKINIAGGITLNTAIGGTADIYLIGGTWSASGTSAITSNCFINGNLTISGNVYYYLKTLSYLSGIVNVSNAVLNLTSACTIIDFHKIFLNKVIISAGQTITFNRFFQGRPNLICSITSTGANYTILFQDNFEKIAKNVFVSGCTVSRRGQLLIATNPLFNTNRNTNIGIRYINQSPNGFAKNQLPTTDDSLTGVFGGLVNDPCFQKQG